MAHLLRGLPFFRDELTAKPYDSVGTTDEFQGFREERYVIEGERLAGAQAPKPPPSLREHDQEEPQEAQDEGHAEEPDNHESPARKRARRATRATRTAKASRHQPTERADRERSSKPAF